MYKKLISLLLCALLIFSAAMPIWAEETVEETALRKMVITSEEEFLELAENCRLDAYSQNLEVILVVDLDLTGYEFEGIPVFCGIFDGRGNEITGLDLKAEGSMQGLFRWLTDTAVVKNLSLSGTVHPGGSRDEVGAIAGRNDGQILSCHFTGILSGNDYVGGIAGTNDVTGVIEDCTVSGDIHGGHFVGGIAGINSGVIRHCGNAAMINTTPQQNNLNITDITLDTLTNTEDISTVTDIGGIAGISSGVIRSCENEGNVGYRHMGYNIGGIAGTQTGYIADCVNRGSIAGRKEIGGIVGQLEPVSQIAYTEDTLQILQGQLNTMSGLVNQASGNAQANANEVSAQLEALQNQAETARDAVGTLFPDEENPQLPDMDTIVAAQNTLTTTLDAMPGTLNSIASASEATLYGLIRDLNAISGQIGAMGQTINNASENLGGGLKDISDQDTEELLAAKVEVCENHGAVLADMNAGGIAGAVAVENDMDVFEDWMQTGESSLNFQAEVRAVVLNCRNNGDVTGSKQNVGGIAGWQSLGLVKNCGNTGSVNGTNANYVGGISGLSTGYLRSNYAKCTVQGETYIGGIAGSATVVTDSLSWVKITDAREKLGAILGYAEAPQTDVQMPISGNLYLCVDTDQGAIDGINYAGQAESAELEAFMGIENLPQAFETVTVHFLFGDGEEKKIDLRPGSSLPMIVIPSVPEKDGAAGEWDGLDTAKLENILFDMSFEAVYSSRRGTIQSEQTNEKGRPLVLAEGAFAADAQVSAEAADGQLRLDEGQTLFGAWILHVPEGTETLRFLYEGEDEVKLLTCGEDGAWSEVVFARDGSYLVFPATSGVMKLAIVEEQNSLLPWVVVGCGLAVVAGAGILIALRIRKKKKA